MSAWHRAHALAWEFEQWRERRRSPLPAAAMLACEEMDVAETEYLGLFEPTLPAHRALLYDRAAINLAQCRRILSRRLGRCPVDD